MNNLESALLTGFICVSYFAGSMRGVARKVIDLNGKLIRNNVEVIRNNAKASNRLFKTQEEHATDLFEFKEYAVEKEQEKIEVINAITEMNHRAAQSMPFVVAMIQPANPVRREHQYPFVVIHEISEDSVQQLNELVKSEGCWIEPFTNTRKRDNGRILVDIAIMGESQLKVDFSEFLVKNRINSYLGLYKALPQEPDRVPMSIKDVRKNKCVNCENVFSCKAFQQVDLLDFSCPREGK